MQTPIFVLFLTAFLGDAEVTGTSTSVGFVNHGVGSREFNETER